jgi:hypothetical protein
MAGIDYSKLTEESTAKDLVEMLVPAIVANLPKTTQKSPEELAREMQPILQKNTETIKTISEVEAEVPRLKIEFDGAGNPIPNPFRNAFAYFVAAQKENRTFSTLKESMKSFLSISDAVVKDKVQQQTASDAGKHTAGTPPEGGEGIPPTTTPEEDILGGIIEAHDEYAKKFTF